ncbi:guanylate kinase [Capnocytophaga canimorsus]|uniref:guanylate kinase n=1 Tax=Capnocytophaga canimorsus TaxID=28188 RepID=UPI0037D48FC8
MSGKLIIFSAPSGSGKTTIVRELLKHSELNLSFSISTTSRLPRGQEKNGVDYYFVSVEEFKTKIAAGDFLEWEEVYTDNFYGTTRAEIERLSNLGKNILLDIDVFGGINVKKQFGTRALSLFIQPPNIEELRRRLENRQTETAEKINMRIAKASTEMAQAHHFDKIIINDALEDAVAQTLLAVKSFLNTK